MISSFDVLKRKRKTGDEPFRLDRRPTQFNLLGFWQWAFSNLASNALRGVLRMTCCLNARDISAILDKQDISSNGGYINLVETVAASMLINMTFGDWLMAKFW